MQRPFSQAGRVWKRGGAHWGIGHGLPPVHSAIRAWIASAALLVTARGLQSIGQHAPCATLVNAQSSSLVHGPSSEAAASPAAPRCIAAASEAVIGPAGAEGAAPVEGEGACGAACLPPSGVDGRSGAAFDGRLEATVVAPVDGASFDREAQANASRAIGRARMQRRC